MNKIFSFGTILALVTAPAIAEPSHTSNTFPSNGKMLEDYTYTNQATLTNLKVSSGTATTTASYTDCPSGYPNSDDGATSTDQCYTACTVSDFPANSHIASVTGKNYQGANETDTCAIASCDTGYTLNPGNPDVATAIGIAEMTNQNGQGFAYVNHSGTYTNGTGSTTQVTYGITASDTWAVDFGTGKGIITGKAICSTQGEGGSWGDTSNSVTEDFTDGGYCWCQPDAYIPDGAQKQNLYVPWVLYRDSLASYSGGCAGNCARYCGYSLYDYHNPYYRPAILGAITPSASSCQANTIQITWADADAADITANNAGSVTYGGDIRTPRKAVHKAGKVFTGWTFNTPGN